MIGQAVEDHSPGGGSFEPSETSRLSELAEAWLISQALADFTIVAAYSHAAASSWRGATFALGKVGGFCPATIL